MLVTYFSMDRLLVSVTPIFLPAGKTEYQWVWEKGSVRDNEQTMAYEEKAATTTATTTESYDMLRVRL